jgi:hypothetical protein
MRSGINSLRQDYHIHKFNFVSKSTTYVNCPVVSPATLESRNFRALRGEKIIQSRGKTWNQFLHPKEIRYGNHLLSETMGFIRDWSAFILV